MLTVQFKADSASLVLVASLNKSPVLFATGFVLLFVFSGLGNGSTYKMIPAVFRLLQSGGADEETSDKQARRLRSALIGFAGAIGAAGGVLVTLAFRQSFLTYKIGNAAHIAFIAFYGVCFVVTWVVYLRPSRKRFAGV